jgi:hypothetical protein
MLEIKVDLVPFGIESGRRTLKKFIIANDGTGDSFIGNYKVLSEDRTTVFGVIKKHERNKDVLFLVKKALGIIAGKV